MELWIALSVAAAFFQAMRFMLQKHLAQVKLSASGATFARFVYSAPFALIAAYTYLNVTNHNVPTLAPQFWLYGSIGGFAQIAATVCTVMLFGHRNFAVGLAFKKTEVLMAAIIGLIFLGDLISPLGCLALCIGFSGVLVLSGPIETEGNLWRRLLSPSAVLGLSAGALFGVSAVSYRAASLLVPSSDPFERAVLTLAAVTSMQMLGMAIWLYVRDKEEINRVLKTWRTAIFVGLTSIAGTFCWFTAFTLQNAAYVKAVGQVELIFAFAASTLFFGEQVSRREILGIFLIVASVLLLVLAY